MDSFGYRTSGLICDLKMINAEVACTTSERLQHDSRATSGRNHQCCTALARLQNDSSTTGRRQVKQALELGDPSGNSCVGGGREFQPFGRYGVARLLQRLQT